MSKPRLLDLFCGAGGCSVGYARAGFDVTGVDTRPMPRYPFAFHQADALEFVARHGHEYDAIHASPPCQAYSDLQKQSRRAYEDFIPRTRDLLASSGKLWVVENVEGAPLRSPVLLCGVMFAGLRVIRHRLFESNVPLTVPPHVPHPLVFTHDKRKRHHGKLDQNVSFVQVTGGGNCSTANKLGSMGVEWMTAEEANQAIPPAYTQYIGTQLIRLLVTTPLVDPESPPLEVDNARATPHD